MLNSSPPIPPSGGLPTNGGTPSKKVKRSAQETKDRRMEVFRLNMRGVSQVAMAGILSVNRNTIAADLKWLKEHLREVAMETDKFEEIGEAVKFYEEIEREALFNFHEAESHHAKNNYLVTAINARTTRLKIQMDAGLIEKAPTQVKIDFTKYTTEELIQRRDQLVRELAASGIENVSKN